ncbi:flippase-like domain-containing protein, partial [bacterium]|nr:flippase-like domain-containing protein [bacterium]
MSKAVKFSIGLLFSILGLVYAFRQFNWNEFIDSLRGVNYWYLIGAMAIQLTAVWLRALRWKWLLSPIKIVPLWTTFNATIIGYFGNSVLPVRMGELLRAYIVANNSTLSVAQVIGSLIVERMLDILGVVILALIFLLNFDIIDIPNWFIFSIVLITIILFGILFLISSKKN